MKLLLVWVMLSATAFTGKCAVDLQSASFVCSSTVISEYLQASPFADEIAPRLVMEVFSRHTFGIGQVGHADDRSSAHGTSRGRFQKSWHAPNVSDHYDVRNRPPGSGIYEPRGQANGGLSTEKDNL